MKRKQNKQLKYKNYTMLVLLLAFIVIMFTLTVIKMSK